MAETILEDELIEGAILSHLRDLRAATIGRIESYDAVKQRATVRLQLSHYVPTTDGNQRAIDEGTLQNVPVCFPQGGGGFFVSFPLKKGDPVVVVFCDTPIGPWLAKGQPTAPGTNDMHTLAGALAFPCGPQPSKTPLGDADASAMRLGKDGAASAQIEITDDEIHLGVGASKEVARKGDKTAADTSMAAWIGKITPYVSALAVTAGNPPIDPPTDFGVVNQGSSKVKAED